MVIEHDSVDAAFTHSDQAIGPCGGELHGISATFQIAPDQVAKSFIIVDQENPGAAALLHQALSGTWITEKNSPSCRIALAK
jgi:hypothetical protein